MLTNVKYYFRPLHLDNVSENERRVLELTTPDSRRQDPSNLDVYGSAVSPALMTRNLEKPSYCDGFSRFSDFVEVIRSATLPDTSG